jgi:Na+/proline symporter
LVKAIVPTGIIGLIFAGLLAASMLTYASYLLSWSSIVSQDIVGVVTMFITQNEIDAKKQLIISRMTMTFIMIFIIWWSFGALPPLLYLILSEEIKTAWASEMGWGGFLLAFLGMVLGSLIHNLIMPGKIKNEVS